ncbi:MULTISPECIES: RidA family protein [unclassified Microbacterium]|uniref:RidA family protein n=1 Tax=unclassified Microbacterium TaxID=2609290 RepID=UPI0034469FAE
MDIELLQPAGLVVSPAFSHVAVIPPGATTIHVGGQNGVDDSGAVVSTDAAEQSRRAVENARTALRSAGASLDDVVSWTIFLQQDADLRAAYGAVAPLLARDGAPPLVTTALVAGLAVPGAMIEVSAIAAVLRE